jgi:CBS domain containing-hemolysin-like protein
LEILAQVWGRLLLLVGLLGCSFFFSASEAALFSLRKLEREELKRRGGAGAEAALALLADPRGLLAAVLFGNLVVNVAIFAIATVIGAEVHRQGYAAGPAAWLCRSSSSTAWSPPRAWPWWR